MPEGWVGPAIEAQAPLTAEKVTLRVVVPQLRECRRLGDELVHASGSRSGRTSTSSGRRSPARGRAAGGRQRDDRRRRPAGHLHGDADSRPAQLLLYGQQGIFIPLNDLIEQHGVPRQADFADYPTVQDIITAPDGNIYSMPNINDCYHCRGSCKLWINKAWLDKLGLACRRRPTSSRRP